MVDPIPNARWSDAWLFLAIHFATDSGPSSLARVIAAADAIQHAILTWQEVDGGLFRLIEAGYVAVDGESISLTSQGRHVISLLKAGTVLETQDELAALLGAPAWSPQQIPAREIHQREIINTEIYDAAVARYTHHPARTLEGG